MTIQFNAPTLTYTSTVIFEGDVMFALLEFSNYLSDNIPAVKASKDALNWAMFAFTNELLKNLAENNNLSSELSYELHCLAWQNTRRFINILLSK